MSHANHVDGEIFVPDYSSRSAAIRSTARLLGVPEDDIWERLEETSKTPPVDPQPEAVTIRVPVEPTDLDYRTAALNAAIEFHKTEGGIVTRHAKYFEKYLRGEAA